MGTKEKHNNWDRIQNHLKHMNKTDHIVSEVTAEEANANDSEKDLMASLEKLSTLLPYNLQYDQNLLEDDLTKFCKAEEEPVLSSEEEEDEQMVQNEEVQPEMNNLIFAEDNNPNMLVDNEELGGENSLILCNIFRLIIENISLLSAHPSYNFCNRWTN